MTVLDYILVSFAVFGTGAIALFTLAKLLRNAASTLGNAAQSVAWTKTLDSNAIYATPGGIHIEQKGFRRAFCKRYPFVIERQITK